MSHIIRLGLITAALTPTLAAQPWLGTSPRGFEFIEGFSVSDNVLASEPTLRYQQIDATNDDPMGPISSIGFRRDGQALANPDAIARMVEVELTMAEGDVWAFSLVFDGNRQANDAVVVNRKMVSFPDWTQVPPSLPAPVDLTIAFDQAWSYSGREVSCRDLIWEMKVFSNSAAGMDYPFDLEYVGPPGASFGQTPPPRESMGVELNTGCQVPGAPGPFRLQETMRNDRTMFEIESIALDGVPGQPVTLFMSTFDAALPLPQLCTTLHALPDVIVPNGIMSPGRVVRTFIRPLPYNKSFIGVDLYLQAITPDASQSGLPFALSGAQRLTVPADPDRPTAGRIWGTSTSGFFAAFGPAEGGVIVHFGL
ncbi:MAG: hypothetical protein AAF628_04795 [Planctomycetota bacterium]